jgi:hypothetical protein
VARPELEHAWYSILTVQHLTRKEQAAAAAHGCVSNGSSTVLLLVRDQQYRATQPIHKAM